MIDPTATGTAVPTVPVLGWEPAVVTARGVAACRLSEFADQWATLNQADRAWFAEWLTELLVDACQEPAALR